MYFVYLKRRIVRCCLNNNPLTLTVQNMFLLTSVRGLLVPQRFDRVLLGGES